jgi:hypothetical protein
VKGGDGQAGLGVQVVRAQIGAHERALLPAARGQAADTARSRGQHFEGAVDAHHDVPVAHLRAQAGGRCHTRGRGSAQWQTPCDCARSADRIDVGPTAAVLVVVELAASTKGSRQPASASFPAWSENRSGPFVMRREYAITLGHADHRVAFRRARFGDGARHVPGPGQGVSRPQLSLRTTAQGRARGRRAHCPGAGRGFAPGLLHRRSVPGGIRADRAGRGSQGTQPGDHRPRHPSDLRSGPQHAFRRPRACLAESMGAEEIALGINALDYSGYPDCRPEWLAPCRRSRVWAPRSGFLASR